MNNKTIFLDKVFLSRLYPSLIGCISQNVTIFISLFIIWWLNGSIAVVFKMDTIRPIIVLSVILNILVNGSILAIEIWYRSKVDNLFLFPIDSNLNYKELKDYVYKNEEDVSYDKYNIPIWLLFINVGLFIVPYILGENWQSALFNSFLYFLPFHVGFLSIHIIKIGIEIIFLILRYIIQNYR